MSNENEKIVEMNQEATENIQEPESNSEVKIQEIKKGPKAWFDGLKTWQKVVLGGAVVGVVVYGGIKIYKGVSGHKVIEAEGKEILNTLQDAASEELIETVAEAV